MKKNFAYFFKAISLTVLFLLTLFSTQALSQVKDSTLVFNDSTKAKNISTSDSLKLPLTKPILFTKLNSVVKNISKDFFISKENIESIDYRTSNDIFSFSQYGYFKDLGSVGTPGELLLYGQIPTSTSILNDGSEVNNRMTSSFNLMNMLSENINEIEIVPLSTSFLYGKTNISALNIVSREPDTKKPFSRMKFYEASDDEGFIDGMFNIVPFKKFVTYFELSNQTTGSRYLNSSSSSWKGNIRLSYLLSDNVNFRLNFTRFTSSSQLNGGVDADAILSKYSASQFDQTAFDNKLATVRFTNRYMNNFSSRVVASSYFQFLNGIHGDFSYYYQSDEIDFRQNVSGSLQDSVSQVKRENYSITNGLKLNVNYSDFLIDAHINSYYENSRFNSQSLINQSLQKDFSLSGSVSLKLNEIITPTFSAKYLNHDNTNYLGFGANAFIKLTSSANLFLGYSNYKIPMTFYEKNSSTILNLENNKNINTFEIAANYSAGIFEVSIGYHFIKNDNYLIPAFTYSDKTIDEISYVMSKNSKYQELTSKINLKIWKFNLENKFNYYLDSEERILRGLPSFNYNCGIYYIDTLFNDNLKLKTGFNFYSYGERFTQRFDFEKGISSSYTYNLTTKELLQISPTSFSTSYQVDFFLAGRIKDNAVIYFTWENLLDSQFYIIPYYPKQPRGLRLGVMWEFLD